MPRMANLSLIKTGIRNIVAGPYAIVGWCLEKDLKGSQRLIGLINRRLI